MEIVYFLPFQINSSILWGMEILPEDHVLSGCEEIKIFNSQMEPCYQNIAMDTTGRIIVKNYQEMVSGETI